MASEFTSTAFYTKLKEEKKLVGVKCQDCGHLSPEARPMCPECHRFNMEWYQFSGKAKLSTFTCISIVPVAMSAKGYGRDKPYCTGIVTLEEGPRILSNLINIEPDPAIVKCDMPVEVVFEKQTDEVTIPLFQPAG